jgi:uncharacterized protein (TIGR00255 family)
MINSMTGFGSKEANIVPFGKIRVELRSTNHKFLDIVLHLPEGFLSLEDRIKKQIEAKVKRGRVICVVNIITAKNASVFINKQLLKSYVLALKEIEGEFSISSRATMDTLINLPGVLSLTGGITVDESLWPRLKTLVNQAIEELVKMRAKEGRATHSCLKGQLEILKKHLGIIRTRFKKVVSDKLISLKTSEERSSFLKDTDITEEIDRLAFHVRNFAHKFHKPGPIGKELDFVAQEMQRESNTMGAKSFDANISARVVQIKSQVEKIREQLQNIE